MRISSLLFVFGCLAVMDSCASRTVSSEQELKDYILDDGNGLNKSILKGDVNVQMLYRPADLVWTQELRGVDDEEARNLLRNSYDSLSYFMLKLSRQGEEIESAFVPDPEQYRRVINYLSFDIRDQIFLVQNGDTIPALDVLYTRTFGGHFGTNVMAVFKGNLKNLDADVNICFNDDILGLGTTIFEFEIEDIKNTPTLAFN